MRSALLHRILRSPSPAPEDAEAPAAPKAETEAKTLADSAIVRERIERLTGRPSGRKRTPSSSPPPAAAPPYSSTGAGPESRTPKEEARRQRETARLKSLLASRSQRSSAVCWASLSGSRGKPGGAPESPGCAAHSVVTAGHKAQAAQKAAAAVMSEEERKRDEPLRPEEPPKAVHDHHDCAEVHGSLPSHREKLALEAWDPSLRRSPERPRSAHGARTAASDVLAATYSRDGQLEAADHSSDSDVHPARDRRGHASLRTDGRPFAARQPVRLIPDSSDQRSSSDSDEDFEYALRRTNGGAATSRKKRAEGAFRSSPRRSRSKSNSRLQFGHLKKRWEDDRRLEREELAKSRSESSELSLQPIRSAIADSMSRDECLRARLEQIDGILETVLRSSEVGARGGTATRLVTSNSTPGAPGSYSHTDASGVRVSEGHGDVHVHEQRDQQLVPLDQLLAKQREKELERGKEVERASRHIANRLASAFDDIDARNTMIGRGERGMSLERDRPKSPGLAEKQHSKSPQQDSDWIARHTYVSMMKARPTLPRHEENEMSRKCEILDTLLQQRDEKIRVLKSDLVIADATREKLSTNVNILEDTVKSLRQKNMHFEGQLARSVDVCHLLKDEVTKFANELKESESALLKQGELLQNLKTECEAKRKVEQLHEASWTSQIQALESQLDIAKRARESQGQHHRQLMAELENQIAILQQQKKEDGEKFAQDFGRAAAREAELAEINRQLRRDLAVLRAQATEKERTGKELQESEVSILAAAVDSYEQALKELGAERDSLESQHRALTSSVDSFKQALEDSRWRSATLEQENSDLKAQLEGLCKKDILRSQGLSKRIESLEQVKTVYELTINELSESSVKANQGLSEQALKENKKLEEHNQSLVRQRDELADRLRESLITREGEGWDRLNQAVESIGDLKKMVEMLEDERNKLQKARAADAVTIRVLKESCEVVQTEHQRQIELDKAERERQAELADCLRHECEKLRAHSKTMQETVVQLMCKQRDRALEESANKSASLNSTSLKERMDQLIQRVSGVDVCAAAQYNLNGSEQSVMMQALHDWQRHMSITYLEDSGDDHALRMEALRSPPSSKQDRPSSASKNSSRLSGAKASWAMIKDLEAKRDELERSLKEYKRKCLDLEGQLAHKEEALFVAEEARVAAEEARAEAEGECRELREVLADHEKKLRVSTRAASAEAKGHARQLANMEKTVAVLSAENEALAQDKLELQALLLQEEHRAIALIKESDRLQKTLDAVRANGNAIPPQNADQIASSLTMLLRPPREGGNGSGGTGDVLLGEGGPGALAAGLDAVGLLANHSVHQDPHVSHARCPSYPVSHALSHTSLAAQEAGSATGPKSLLASHSAYAAADGGRGAVSSFTQYTQLDGGRTRAPISGHGGQNFMSYSANLSSGLAIPHPARTSANLPPQSTQLSPANNGIPLSDIHHSAFIPNAGLDSSFRTVLNLTSPRQERDDMVLAAEHDSYGSDATYMSPLAGDASSYLAAKANVSVGGDATYPAV